MMQEAGTPNYLYTRYKANERKKVRLQLVCDPTFNREANPEPSRLPIGPEKEVLCGPVSTYDIGDPIHLASIPPGVVIFFVGSEDISLLTAGQVARLAKSELVFRLTCYQYDPRTAGLRARHKRDATWKVVLRTDPLSKNLVCSREALPVWCDECRAELFDIAFQCRQCKSGSSQVGLCWPCYETGYYKHNQDRSEPHKFKEVEIPSFGRPLFCRMCQQELWKKAHICRDCPGSYAICESCRTDPDSDLHTHLVGGEQVYRYKAIDL